MPKPSNKKKIRKNISTAHPYAFRKLPHRIQLSKPMDYRYVDYDYASYKCQQWGIKSARQYRAFCQAFNPQGFPGNPERTYREWESWNNFLNVDNGYAGTAETSIKSHELMPFWEAVSKIQSRKFKTRDQYYEAWDNGQIPAGIPRYPQSRYKEFDREGGWKNFLGKKITNRMQAAQKLEPVCALCQTVGQSPNVLTLLISKEGIYDLKENLERNTHLRAVRVYYWYPEFSDYIFEMLDQIGSRQDERTWLFNNVNDVFYELQNYLETYRA
jgi:hypothetical protein